MDKLTKVLMFGVVVFVSVGMYYKNFESTQEGGMTVLWEEDRDRINFNLSAPTTGWVCVGFNDQNGMTGAYLVMGRVKNGKAEVSEHYTSSPGNYGPISDLGGDIDVRDVSGSENNGSTQISFSLPKKAPSKYQRDLEIGKTYTMIIAFSRDDDYQHHSMMRVNKEVKL